MLYGCNELWRGPWVYVYGIVWSVNGMLLGGDDESISTVYRTS